MPQDIYRPVLSSDLCTNVQNLIPFLSACWRAVVGEHLACSSAMSHLSCSSAMSSSYAALKSLACNGTLPLVMLCLVSCAASQCISNCYRFDVWPPGVVHKYVTAAIFIIPPVQTNKKCWCRLLQMSWWPQRQRDPNGSPPLMRYTSTHASYACMVTMHAQGPPVLGTAVVTEY